MRDWRRESPQYYPKSSWVSNRIQVLYLNLFPHSIPHSIDASPEYPPQGDLWPGSHHEAWNAFKTARPRQRHAATTIVSFRPARIAGSSRPKRNIFGVEAFLDTAGTASRRRGEFALGTRMKTA